MKNLEHEDAAVDELDLEAWSTKHPGKRPPRCRRYRIRVDKDRFVVQDSAKTGAEILALVGHTPNERDLVQTFTGNRREPVEPDQLVDFREPGVERFETSPKQPADYEIVVNARPRTVTDRQVTFEQVVQFAFPGQHDPTVVFSMTYRHAASKPHAGELGPGGVVRVKKKGTVFNVTRTVKS